MKIKTIIAREILDSRGNPTLEADVILSTNEIGRASVPSGATTGEREACELRDNDVHRFHGKGVTKAVHHINTEISTALKGFDVSQQATIDEQLCLLDGTENKSRLGANALLAVSLACARAYSLASKQPLFLTLQQNKNQNKGNTMCMPVPMMNVLNGGGHADNNVDIQEFMIMPVGANNFSEAIQMGTEIFHVLKSVLKKQGLNTAVGDEGGFAPNLTSNRQALDILSEAVNEAGFKLGDDIVFSLDVAASELYQDQMYHLTSENRTFDSLGMINYYNELINAYPIISIEDGLDENDWLGWEEMTRQLGAKIQLVGDDLFVTNPKILKEGID